MRDAAAMQKKTSGEKAQEQAYMAKHAGGANPWEEISSAVKVEREIYPSLTYVERMRGFSSDMATFARNLVRAAEENPKPNGERLREFRDSALPSLEQRLFSSAPIYKNLEALMLGIAFS